MTERERIWAKLKNAVVRYLPIQFFLWIAFSLMYLIPIAQPVTLILEGSLFLFYLVVRFANPIWHKKINPHALRTLIWIFALVPLMFLLTMRYATIPIVSSDMLVFIQWNPRGQFELKRDLDFDQDDLKSKDCVIRYLAGRFEGNDHALSNLSVPLFCEIESDGIVRNLTLKDVMIEGDTSIGAVSKENRGTISDVHVKGTLNILHLGGGIAGVNRGTIEHSSFEGSLSGSMKLGGIAGYNMGIIRTSSTVGAISGEGSIGGIAGDHVQGLIENCLTDMDLTGTFWVGGIAGIATGEIARVVVLGDLIGPDVGVVKANVYNQAVVALFGGIIDSTEALLEENVYYLQNQSFVVPAPFRPELSDLSETFYRDVLGFDPDVWEWDEQNGFPRLR